jgi:hydrogenase expression/formation protein HypD
MKYVTEFRDPEKVKVLQKKLSYIVEEITLKYDRKIRIMEVCGGHTHTLFKYGLKQIIPTDVEMIHGPGCPVCVLPKNIVDNCILMSKNKNVIITTFGDAMRVPGSVNSLLQAKADGADIRMVYSPSDSLEIAKKHPDKDVVFFGLGFETTMPSTAFTIVEAHRQNVNNFSLYCNHITIPQTLKALLDDKDLNIDAFIGPGHVSMVIGTKVFDFISEVYKKPIVVSGFEPLDILQSILMVLEQLKKGKGFVENQYNRVVNTFGNKNAIKVISEVYEIRDFCEWRGLGSIANSGVKIKRKYNMFDAEKKYNLKKQNIADPEECQCGEVLKGFLKPPECKVFGNKCTPENPLGALMVSTEGACSAYYKYSF